MTFRVFRIVIWLTTLAIAVSPELSVFYGPFTDSVIPAQALSGVLLMIGGLVVALLANFTLSAQWRSGVDSSCPATLVQTGMYRISRNPGYIGVGLGQLGFFIAFPSLFTLLCLLVGLRALYLQVLYEEKHLHQRFQATFSTYTQCTPRFLPLPQWLQR